VRCRCADVEEVWIAGGVAGVQTWRRGGMECLKLDADVALWGYGCMEVPKLDEGCSDCGGMEG